MNTKFVIFKRTHALVKRPLLLMFMMSGLLPFNVSGQEEFNDTSLAIADTQIFDVRLFDSDELLKIILRFDITTYKRKKPVDEYLDAALTYYISDTDSITKNIKLRARGNFRRTFCDFPPLRLNFSVSDSTGGEFGGIDKLKLVPHCKTGLEVYVLKEYLAYKLYNVLTENSFRVRLLEIDYINTHKKSKPIKEYGFAIEPHELFEKRTNSTEVKADHLTQKNIIPDVMDRVAIFNYMIGNTDWSVPNQHNVQVFTPPDSKQASLGILIPYDFDYSGLVDAPYAVPYEALPIESVRDRLYVGICRDEGVYINAIKEFAGKKEDFYKVIHEFPYLTGKSKQQMINYLNSFYSQFDRRNSVIYDILKSCKDF